MRAMMECEGMSGWKGYLDGDEEGVDDALEERLVEGVGHEGLRLAQEHEQVLRRHRNARLHRHLGCCRCCVSCVVGRVVSCVSCECRVSVVRSEERGGVRRYQGRRG